MSTREPTEIQRARRAQILRAAAQVFARRGYDATRIQDVAEEAGVAYGLVYHYFGSKDALLRQVSDEAWSAFGEAIEGISRSARPPHERVRAVLDYVLGAIDALPDLVRVVVLDQGRRGRLPLAAEGEEPDAAARAMDALTALFRAAAAEGALRPGLDPSALPLLLMGMLDVVFHALGAPAAPPEAAARAVMPPRDALRETLHTLVREGLFPHRPPPAA